MSEKRFDTYEVTKQSRPPTETCSSCEHYYTGACDGLRGWCKNYKQYRSLTLEQMVKVSIGTTVLVGGAIMLLQILFFTLR